MNIKQQVIDWVVKKLKVPSSAMKMFKAANEISGIDKNLLPDELIPLNAIQISRGLLNYTFFQSRLSWIFPFWAEEQYNPKSKAFIPRSHLGLSMNVTNRNWTAAGSPESRYEPIVDPRGLITPFPNGWSIDIWLKNGNEIYFPSKRGVSGQRLIKDLPVVETKYSLKNIEVTSTVFTQKTTLGINVEIVNNTPDEVTPELIFSVRPFNPEGISLINSIAFDKGSKKLSINKEKYISFSAEPDFIFLSNYEKDDAADFLRKDYTSGSYSVECPVGMATGVIIFKKQLKPGGKKTYNLGMSLDEKENIAFPSLDETLEQWNKILSEGMTIITPDEKINSLFRASAAALLMLVDEDEITPGPFTYHQFWFRDAAYMVYALDKLGYSKQTRKILASFNKHQMKDGYYRSQKGEWDSNGQALWTVYQHYLLTNDKEVLEFYFNSLFKGVKWIDSNRLLKDEFKAKNIYGLLPRGLSAEHLGLVDYYYWDNFWSLAGIYSFIQISKELKKESELNYAKQLFDEYQKDVNVSVKNVRDKFKIDTIPAGPTRNNDCGMIGSVCGIYPLQVFNSGDESMSSTLKFLEEHYFIKGLFFQNFIHSGMNIYLTLQIAHSYLFTGKREKFIEILYRAVEAASPTLNYPEAIHPETRGGSMGDGHHGWAAAEIVLLLRDAFFYERSDNGINELILLSGIPAEWFAPDKKFSVSNAPVHSGNLSVEIFCEANYITINLKYIEKKNLDEKWKIILPCKAELKENNNKVLQVITGIDETTIEVTPGSLELKLLRK